MRFAGAVTFLVALVCAAPSEGLALTVEEANTVAAHERVSLSVVLIVVRGREPEGEAGEFGITVTGSGFAIEPGLVATNYHVVEYATRIEVVLQDGDYADAVVVGTEPGFDLALLRVPFEPARLPPAPLGAASGLRMGQKVLTVSTPLGLWHSLTVGTVSGLNRELPGLDVGPSLIQFDAPLNPGQSGGPLVDSEGRVVGVTTAKLQGAEGIGLAIPVDTMVHILPALKTMGHAFRPNLGFSGVSVDPGLARLLDLPVRSGVLVQAVDPGGVAQRGGIVAGARRVVLGGRPYVLGGDIIVAANGLPLAGAGDLTLRLLASQPGEEIVLTVVGPGAQRRPVSLMVPEMRH